MKKGYGTLYPLLVPCSAGREMMERCGLGAEAPTILTDEVNGVADLVVTAHAPFSGMDGRYSIADVDDARRSDSIDAIRRYVEEAVHRFPSLRKINMHASPKIWVYDTHMLKGNYDRLIDAIREIADVAAGHGLEVVVENNRAYWTTVPDSVGAAEANRDAEPDYFATGPEEWIQIQKDVDRPNVFRCLDSSHACTFAQIQPEGEAREAVMREYLEDADTLRHVHWNGNDLGTNVGRDDTHMTLGKDGLPEGLHSAIKALGATLLLEHFQSEQDLEEELEYVRSL